MGSIVTIFSDLTGSSLVSAEMTLSEIETMIADPAAAAAEPERLIKLARFGSTASAGGSLRHDGNVVSIGGAEVDVDDSQGTTLKEACARLVASGIAFGAHSTKRSRPGAERFRILAPTSRELPPGARNHLVDRINGILGGIAARESWNLSQGYFISVDGKPPADLVFVDSEEFVDEASELDAGALPYQPPPSSAGATGPGGKPDYTKLDEAMLRQLIEQGDSYFHAASELAWRWGNAGVRQEDSLANLEHILDAITSRNEKWRKARAALPRWVERVYARFAAAPSTAKAKGGGRPLIFAPVDPWPDAVDGAELLDTIAEIVRDYVVLPVEAAWAATLWTAHTYVFQAMMITPRLILKSAQKRSGKTTLMIILKELVARPLSTSNISASGLYRAVEAAAPTLLVDEADSFVRQDENLRGVINDGFIRGAQTLRNVGDSHEPKMFSCHAPLVLASIKGLHDTLEDRSIVILLRRRLKSEPVTRLRLDRLGQLAPFTRKLQRWANDNVAAIEIADPDMPGQLNDRAQDCWRILVAIADRASPAWGERARKAALALSLANVDIETVETMLLADIHDLYAVQTDPLLQEVLFSREIAAALAQLEGHPWPEFGERGLPVSPNQIAHLLKSFGILPSDIHRGTPGAPGHRHARGYRRKQFDEAFDRYL